MAAKLVRISNDGGATYFSVPGPGAELAIESATLNDTILGQSYTSEFPGLQSWSVSSSGYYKGLAGYVADIKKAGTPTAVTAEAFTLVSGKTYQISNSAKEVWDATVVPVVKDGTTTVVSSNIASYDYLFGIVTLASSYSVTSNITANLTYLPMAVFGKGQSFTLTQQADALDQTTYITAQADGGYMTNAPGLRTVSLDIDGIYDVSADNIAQLQARSQYVIEINPDGNGKSVARGFFYLLSVNESGDVGANEVESLSFNLSVPSSDYIPFGWQHETDTTLPDAIEIALTAWEDEDILDIQYLPNGVGGAGGQEGSVVVTDLTLSSSVDGLNEFTMNFVGTGALTDV
jgi:hypothetical protein